MVKLSELPSRIYQIEDGVPMPSKRRAVTPELYALAKEMKVGQSVLVPKQRTGITANLARATGFKFTQRVEGDQMRIWRTE